MRHGTTHVEKKGLPIRLLRSKIGLALILVVCLAAALAAAAVAGIWEQDVPSDGNNVRIRVVHTYAGNFDSGWHTHPGLTLVQVTKGSMQITQGSCTPKTVSAGDSYMEVPNIPVRAVAVGEIEWTTTFVLQYGQTVTVPLSTGPCP